jgi:hypothetical protein
MIWAVLPLGLMAPSASWVAGQETAGSPDPAGATRTHPGPLLVDPDHWVYGVLDRAGVAGVARGWLPGARPASAGEITAALEAALAGMAPGDPWYPTLSEALHWLDRELGDGSSPVRLVPSVGLGASESADGPETWAVGRVAVIARAGRGVAAWAEPEPLVAADGGEAELDVRRAGVAWRLGPVNLAAAREVGRFGPGTHGSVVLGDRSRRDMLLASLAEGVRLPGWLGSLGPIQATLSLSGIAADSLGPGVGVLAAELRLRPHERVHIGLYRTTVVAGTVGEDRMDLGDVSFLIIGKHTPYDDQRGSVSVAVRTDPWGLPVVPYLEWGAEDSAGIEEDPAIIAGVWLPSIPVGVPAGLRYEYVAVGRDARALWGAPCCFEQRNWYRHGTPPRARYVDGDRQLLGHRLGGYGHEHVVEIEVPLLAAGWVVKGEGFVREREARNLLAAVYPGRSVGGTLDLRHQRGALGMHASMVGERGVGWRRLELDLALSLLSSPF